MKSGLIVVPVYNEERNIEKVYEELKKYCREDILFVNDASKDNTEKVLADLRAEYITLKINSGYSGALMAGYSYSLEKNYSYLVQFDGDGQHCAFEIEKIYQGFLRGNDITLGSRYLDGSYQEKLPNKIGRLICSKILKIICRRNFTDVTSGFQCLSIDVVRYIIENNGMPEYPDVNHILDMITAGFKLEEVAVTMRSRETGASMHKGLYKRLRYVFVMAGLSTISVKNYYKKRGLKKKCMAHQ